MLRLSALMLLLVAPVLWGTGAAAQELIYRIQPATMATIMKDAGYRAEIVDDKGETFIRTGLSGFKANVFFYDCKPSGCSALQFYGGFEKDDRYSLASVNKWNKTKRYGKASLDDDGSVNLEFDVDLDGGVPIAYLKEKVILFESILAKFAKF